MTRDELYELMEDGNLGYACVYFNGDQGMHTDFMFQMTAKNIANFIGKYAYEADKIIMTDMCDSFICESVFGGFLMNCPDQVLCREIIPYLAAIQMGAVEAKDFPVATRAEMEELWHAEEEEVMRAEFRML
ncbi:MAG: resolvase [Firmicutes bacterium HGW-Firmicutes-2]|jgi:hypothetical protein|nr:MAG: resolvase [Firmicutes bacterium HGW-Firmicutes-2]